VSHFVTVLAPSYSSTLSLHDALPIYSGKLRGTLTAKPPSAVSLYFIFISCAVIHMVSTTSSRLTLALSGLDCKANCAAVMALIRSEEHTSELQSRENLVCRLLLEKKK